MAILSNFWPCATVLLPAPPSANTCHGRPLLARYLRRGLVALPRPDELKGVSRPPRWVWIWPNRCLWRLDCQLASADRSPLGDKPGAVHRRLTSDGIPAELAARPSSCKRHGTIVIMEACRLFSRRRVATTACAVLPTPGIVE